jgi:hypothetical protein
MAEAPGRAAVGEVGCAAAALGAGPEPLVAPRSVACEEQAASEVATKAATEAATASEGRGRRDARGARAALAA